MLLGHICLNVPPENPEWKLGRIAVVKAVCIYSYSEDDYILVGIFLSLSVYLEILKILLHYF
jgi:hypothetical protein